MAESGAIRGNKGRYEVLGRIASGAMGHVHLARHASEHGSPLGEVAIKRIRPELATDDAIVRMFEDEAEISRRLSHPNIVRILEAGRIPDDGPFLAMELVPGVNLQVLVQRLLDRDRVLPVPLVLDVVSQVLDGLEYAHRALDEDGSPLGVVHRDVSPQNIMVSFTGEVKLFDFGVGKARIKAHQTNPGFLKGKLAYMSPEQIRNGPVDARSDIFSVGVMAYEALVLVHPFYGKTDAMLMRAVMEREPPDPASIDPSFPAELSEILLRALSKVPDARFENARTMREALDRFVSTRVFPPGPSLAELMQDLFQARLRMEARARRRADDEMLVRALRGAYDDANPDSVSEPVAEPVAEGGEIREERAAREAKRRGEQMFADLPTADILPDERAPELRLPEAEPLEETTAVVQADDPPGYAGLPTLLPAGAEARALETLRLLVEATPTPLFVSRVEDGRILFANQPMADLFGLAPDSAGSESAHDLYVNPADRSRIVLRARQEGAVRNHLVEMKRRNGARFWASLSVRYLKHLGERVLIGGVADVTQRVQIESRLARRLGHERRLAQAAAALLRSQGSEGSAGLFEALEHLRAGTDADRVVLVENEAHPELGLLMHRRHAVGVEGPLHAPRGPIPYEAVPRWRMLFERGDALRGRTESLPDAERNLLEALGVRLILAAPIRRNDEWLGFLALEATEWRSDWTDEDVAALESLSGILAGELARRRAREREACRIEGEPARLLSLGARLEAELKPVLARLGGLDRPGEPPLSDAELAERVRSLARLLRKPGDREAAIDLAGRLRTVPGLVVVGRSNPPLARARPELVERFVEGIVVELAKNPGLTVSCERSMSGDMQVVLQFTPAPPAVVAALQGDAEALSLEGTRIGMLSTLADELGAELRVFAPRPSQDEARGTPLEKPPGDIAIVLELPAAFPANEPALAVDGRRPGSWTMP